jgi:hypothetical protein
MVTTAPKNRPPTAKLTLVETKEQAYNATDKQEEPSEIKLANKLPHCLAVVRIEVQEEKEEDPGNTACWPGEMFQTWRWADHSLGKHTN